MASSFRAIDYSIRPAKHIERKMLAETFRRLDKFCAIDLYQYVGFGSIYFSDFLLFHKILGIKEMVSIELDTNNKDRFEFNRPFNCIKMKFGHSNIVLPTLNFKKKTITWLDYDGTLNSNVLQDISTVCFNSTSGSILTVSVNARNLDNIEALGDLVGEGKVPLGITKKDLHKWGTAKVYRDIITNEITQTLQNRNSLATKEDSFVYKQLFNFHYSDDVEMLTVGGIIFQNKYLDTYQSCDFENIPFVKPDSEPFLIKVPRLTYREIRHLDKQLPTKSVSKILASAIPQADLEHYAKLYRYFPTFAETFV